MTAGPAVPARTLILIFVVAVLVRWAYAAGMYAGFGEDALKGPDSAGYLVLGHALVESLRADTIAGWAWLGPDISLMPFFPWLLSLHILVAGDGGAFAYVLTQGVIDAGTAVLVALIAARFAGGRAALAGYAAALTPTFIVLSGLVYTDTPFVFFITVALYTAIRWMEAPSWRWALFLGTGFALAALVRLAGLPFVAAALPFLAIVALLRGRLRLIGLVQLAAAGLIVAAALAPVLARNVAVHGAWSLTPQSGNHLAYWVLPLVKEAATGIPREKTKLDIDAAMRARHGAMEGANPFENSAKYRAYAEAEMTKLGFGAVASAWAYGAIINLATPSVVHVPPVSNLPRTGFYDTAGANFREKVVNFLFGGDNRLYAWLLLGGIAGLGAFRLVQLIGLGALLARRANFPGLMLLGGWVLYILLLNGPIASPKYRLPIEPAMAVLTGAGLGVFRRGRSSSRLQA